MSRSLTALSKCGLLKQEQEQSRTYYAADLPAISRFLQEFHDLLARLPGAVSDALPRGHVSDQPVGPVGRTLRLGRQAGTTPRPAQDIL